MNNQIIFYVELLCIEIIVSIFLASHKNFLVFYGILITRKHIPASQLLFSEYIFKIK